MRLSARETRFFQAWRKVCKKVFHFVVNIGLSEKKRYLSELIGLSDVI